MWWRAAPMSLTWSPSPQVLRCAEIVLIKTGWFRVCEGSNSEESCCSTSVSDIHLESARLGDVDNFEGDGFWRTMKIRICYSDRLAGLATMWTPACNCFPARPLVHSENSFATSSIPSICHGCCPKEATQVMGFSRGTNRGKKTDLS